MSVPGPEFAFFALLALPDESEEDEPSIRGLGGCLLFLTGLDDLDLDGSGSELEESLAEDEEDTPCFF